MTVQDVQRATSRRRKTGPPEVYDFRRPMTLVREHGRILEMAFETFARQWGNQLVARLRASAQISIDSVTMSSYDEYVRSLPTHTVMVMCTLDPSRATAVVQVPTAMTMSWVDYLLGGPGMVYGEPTRELTEIEFELVRDLLQHSLGDLTYAFESILPIKVAVQSVQYAPQFVQAVAASSPVIVATFTAKVGELEDTATIMLPADVILANLRAGEATDSRTADERAAHADALARLALGMEDVPVPVAVRFGPVTVRPADVVGLAVGDVLQLNHPTTRPLDVVVDDVVLAQAAAGTQGTRLACLVVNSEETS
ncbi:flagellar motor switch protein FliM [Cellulomonas fimi]|uniref:Flagellar motor switch protein FliM n=1 Tax=Cellulomonas fimi TaxID=1708 RepID=A0A7Y0QIC8_CELFI|nr:flagellar motor switch protein FliM [Cellulomonas fimi]NMR21063.1 flagellar motor switch protein FliM [Cellulomonas fimi]